MRSFVRNNSLALAMLLAASVAGQIATGFAVHNTDRTQHGEAPTTLPSYLGTRHFIEAVFENWES